MNLSVTDRYYDIPSGDKQFSTDYIKQNNCIFLKENDNQIYIGITDKTPDIAKEDLESYFPEEICFITIDQTQILKWISRSNEADKEINDFNENNLSIEEIANDAPVVNLVNSICAEGIKHNASDIHIECTSQNAIVRYRINGKLQTEMSFEKSMFTKVSSRIKIMSDLNILETRLPQDGRFSVVLENEKTDLRVSVIPSTEGESIVLRILGRKIEHCNIEKLGFTDSQINDIRKMICVPHGLILVSGPTGSGKSTTLNCILHELINGENKIITIEDPVEYSVNGAIQFQVNEKIGLTFGKILRRVLRHDPDIIMVGEIRDKETAELAIRAAMTGHLVLSTIHANDACGAIERLENLDIDKTMIASVLKGSVSQRLITSGSRKNRILIAEEFPVTEKIAQIITSESISNLKIALKKDGMLFMKDNALIKIQNNSLSVNDIAKEIEL